MGDIWNMARLTLKKQLEIEQDQEWIKIHFRSHYSQGAFVIKRKLYEFDQKKIEKVLKGLYYFIDYKYTPTYEEYCDMDSFLNSQKARLRRKEYVFENTIFPDKERRDEALQEIKELKDSILMREHTLLEEYEERFHD